MKTMQSKKTDKQSGGWMMMELVVVIAVLGILLSTLALTLHAFEKFNHYQLARRHCILAAQVQLESITAIGRPIDPVDAQRLWPQVNITLERVPGQGQWRGLTLVTANAQTQSRGKDIQIQLSRYILCGETE